MRDYLLLNLGVRYVYRLIPLDSGYNNGSGANSLIKSMVNPQYYRGAIGDAVGLFWEMRNGMKRRGNGEGSIYQRRDGRWTASITIGGNKRKYIYGKTRKEVQEKMKVALRDQQQGMLVTSPQQTVEQYLKQWLETHKPSIRIRTYERYEQIIRIHLIPNIGRIQLQKLSAIDIQNLYTKLGKNLSSSTVNTLHAML
jgi:hypothetical protein